MNKLKENHDKRLERLRERVNGTPLEFQETESFSGQRGFYIVIRNDFPTAERLLASLAPGPIAHRGALTDKGKCLWVTDDDPGPPPVDENGKPTHEWRMCLLPVGEEVKDVTNT